MKDFTSRKDQIERDFLPRLHRALKRLGVPLNRRAYALVKEELRSAAMVGASEERNHALTILRKQDFGYLVVQKIEEVSVLTVLGYKGKR